MAQRDMNRHHSNDHGPVQPKFPPLGYNLGRSILIALIVIGGRNIGNRQRHQNGCGAGFFCRRGTSSFVSAFLPPVPYNPQRLRSPLFPRGIAHRERRMGVPILLPASGNNGKVTEISVIFDDDKYEEVVSPESSIFESVVNARYACTRFQRYQEPPSIRTQSDSPNNEKRGEFPDVSASLSDPINVQKAYECLKLSQRAPTGFNAQPYRVILVHSQKEKEELSQYCLGRNADRVRDSDCTAVFLADRECGRDGRRFADFLTSNMEPLPSGGEEGKKGTVSTNENATNRKSTSRTKRPLSSGALKKLRVLVLLFSSGYPLPQFIALPFALGVRTGVSILSFFARILHTMKQKYRILSLLLPDIQLLPTLSSAETWSQKNTMLVAMTYILACTSRGMATCPMEGFDANGVRKVLGIPRGRFGIPLLVCAGTPYQRNVEGQEVDDVGLIHGGTLSPRYPLEEVAYNNKFGTGFQST
mmetsp:Transcript_22577/g.46549  ORF Transcript_22577/g.46549 Transcript_22577/m.46549 type:complete len:474 (+) Transcript_22577:67-1488(+)